MVFSVWSLLYTALSSWDQCSSFIVHPATGCFTSVPSRWFLSLFWQEDIMWKFSGQGSKKGVLENHWPLTGHWPLKTNYQSTHNFFTDPPTGLPPLQQPPTLQHVFNWPTNPSTGSTPTHRLVLHQPTKYWPTSHQPINHWLNKIQNILKQSKFLYF